MYKGNFASEIFFQSVIFEAKIRVNRDVPFWNLSTDSAERWSLLRSVRCLVDSSAINVSRMNLRLEGFSVGVDRVREWRENQSIGTNQRFWSMTDDMLGLPFEQLAKMWALAS